MGEIAEVTTCVVVWIEIPEWKEKRRKILVTTCVVVWIEISCFHTLPLSAWSPPAWWCGLKSFSSMNSVGASSVTTCVVVWIEIPVLPEMLIILKVTTCVVVWIEISNSLVTYSRSASHHLRGGVD